MSDFIVDVGFNVQELNKILGNTGGTTATNNTSQSNALATGFNTALKTAGVVGILSSLKVVTESIAFSVSIVSSGIGFIVGSLAKWLIPFFKDPGKMLIDLSVSIINGFMKVGEVIANSVMGAISSIPGINVGGYGTDNLVSFGRLDSNLIQEGREYANSMSELYAQGRISAQDLQQAQQVYSETWKFYNQDLINTLNSQSQEQKKGLLELYNLTTENTGDMITNAIVNHQKTKLSADEFYSQVQKTMDYLTGTMKKIREPKTEIDFTKQFPLLKHFKDQYNF